MKKKIILITGGAGFLGAHLANRLVDDFHVIIVDTLKSVGGISYINPKATFLNHDICDLKLYDKLKDYKIEAIYHLAAQSAGEPSYEDPKYDIYTNSYGTFLLAKYAKESNIKRFIYTSTVAVYGSGKDKSIKEDDLIDPDSIYGVSKYSGELFIRQTFKNTLTKFSVFRVFNTYGPGENLKYAKKGMVSIYASYLWRERPIIVKGSLNRYRNFLYIDDNIDILYKSLYESKSFNQTYNLSTGEKVVVSELISLMLEITNKKDYSIQEVPGTLGDSFGTHANINKLKKDFDWEPKISLKKGLENYFKWIKILPIDGQLSDFHPLNLKNNE